MLTGRAARRWSTRRNESQQSPQQSESGRGGPDRRPLFTVRASRNITQSIAKSGVFEIRSCAWNRICLLVVLDGKRRRLLGLTAYEPVSADGVAAFGLASKPGNADSKDCSMLLTAGGSSSKAYLVSEFAC